MELQEDSNQFTTSYIDFSPEAQRIEFRMVQYIEAEDLDFKLIFEFFETGSRSTNLGSVNFNWNAKSGRTSVINLYETKGFTSCYATNPNMLVIPQSGIIDLSTDYVVVYRDQHQGDYKDGCEEQYSWQNWLEIVGKIQKVQVKLEDLKNSQSDYELKSYFDIEYKIIQGKIPLI